MKEGRGDARKAKAKLPVIYYKRCLWAGLESLLVEIYLMRRTWLQP